MSTSSTVTSDDRDASTAATWYTLKPMRTIAETK
jgi:hypothetical protein